MDEVTIQSMNELATDKDLAVEGSTDCNSSTDDNSGSLRRFNPFNSVDGTGSPGSDSLISDLSLSRDLACNHFCIPPVGSTLEELEKSISDTKKLILESFHDSDRQKQLVNQLILLRLKLMEEQEEKVDESDCKVIQGHKFVMKISRSSQHYCEICSGIILGILHTWYRCSGCGICGHDKCLPKILRDCAKLKISEGVKSCHEICPEKPLSAQNYSCAECKAIISYRSGCGEPRLCDFSGYYYCSLCHWNDEVVIPARIIKNWDFEVKKVCRASKQYLKLIWKKPMFDIKLLNPKLFNFVSELSEIGKMREELMQMKQYLLSCHTALQNKLLLQLKNRQHFVDSANMYSLQDLFDIHEESLLVELGCIHTNFQRHIRETCLACQGKGHICGLCNTDEIIFPFDDFCITCSKCYAVVHRHCFVQYSTCPKCDRLRRRSESS